MSDFLKKMKDLFIVPDENGATTSNEQATNTAAPKPATTAPVAPTSAPMLSASSGKVNDKFTEILFSALQQNNLEGFDYLEFKQSLLSLAKMPMDEATRMQSAYAMAQTMGVTAPKLLDSAAKYLGLLQQEQQKFQEALGKQRSAQIGNREEQIIQLDTAIKGKAEQIKKLTDEITQSQQQMASLKKEIEQSVIKVESTKNDFDASYKHVVGQIQRDVDMMKLHLK